MSHKQHEMHDTNARKVEIIFAADRGVGGGGGESKQCFAIHTVGWGGLFNRSAEREIG